MKTAKRLFCLLLALLTVLSMAGCAGLNGIYGSYEPSAFGREETSVPAAPLSEPDGESPLPGKEDAAPEESSQYEEDATFGGSSAPDESSAVSEAEAPAITEDGLYTSKEDVALYIHTYGRLPDNFITKREARELGWSGGSLEPYAEGCSIGGDRFGNREGRLPAAEGRSYTECDIDTKGAASRGAKRIVFSNDGLVYYTEDHYETFELLYGKG